MPAGQFPEPGRRLRRRWMLAILATLAVIVGFVDIRPAHAEYGDVVKNYPSAFPQFSLAHVLTAAYQELTGP